MRKQEIGDIADRRERDYTIEQRGKVEMEDGEARTAQWSHFRKNSEE